MNQMKTISVTMSADQELNTDTAEQLVRPKVEFQTLLQDAGATKEVFTMKEVIFYLGQYIIQKQLYDQKQQHIVHCSQDALGRVLGVDSFSVKEPRALFAMITKNLVAVKNQGRTDSFLSGRIQHVSTVFRLQLEPKSPPSSSEPQTDRGTEEAALESRSSSPDRRGRKRRRRSWRSCRSSDPGPSDSLEEEEEEESGEEEEGEGRKRRRWSDSVLDRHSSQSSDSHSTSGRSEVTVAASDSESDNFSVEFEVESIDSDDYREDDASLSADDQQTLWTPDSQSSSSMDSQELLPPSPPTPHPVVPELDRSVAAEWRLPDSCLNPCLICQSRPKNGCIVHGRTGHLMSCYVCARKLKKRNKLCPVCRLPIQSVILTYLS
ncbi:E3 ubiquitin-protein ligase Mdm2-like isoform X1 [Cebidichthys violaceus]|uniref:E3 ubiquitin-protein ligase Mdm2-like isoform X1 n=2 Tax=Cebidichthys violaceus TaxID=271503 RepID=UPI0035CA064B